jgi:hypothetical protein
VNGTAIGSSARTYAFGALGVIIFLTDVTQTLYVKGLKPFARGRGRRVFVIADKDCNTFPVSA